MSTTRQAPTDVLIIGAGPAGLATAQSLSRLLHTCIVFSAPTFRNDRSKHMHGVPTWEHRDPAEFRDAARKDILAHYDTVTFHDKTISRIEKLAREDGSSLFRAVDEEGGEWWGRKVVLATGVRDLMLAIDGYEENWGRSIFHCLFCHGYEERGAESAGILAIDHMSAPMPAIFQSRFASRLVSHVTIYTNANPTVTSAIQSHLSTLPPNSKTALTTTINSQQIVKFTKGPSGAEVELLFADGTSKMEAFLAHSPKFELVGGWVEQLGLEVTEMGNLKTSGMLSECSVKGVFVAGDAGAMMKAVTPAIASGQVVAAGVAAQLGEED